MTNSDFEKRISALRSAHEELIGRKNPAADSNGVWTRYTYPILTAAHTPLFWRYDLNPATNPFLLERFGINGTFNSGAIKFDGKYVLVVRVEGNDRKSFFALAESDNGIDGFRFRDHPLTIPPIDESETNLYDMRLTAHEDGWIYGIFCAERHDPSAAPGDLSSAVATADGTNLLLFVDVPETRLGVGRGCDGLAARSIRLRSVGCGAERRGDSGRTANDELVSGRRMLVGRSGSPFLPARRETYGANNDGTQPPSENERMMEKMLVQWREELSEELTCDILPFWMAFLGDGVHFAGRIDGRGKAHPEAGKGAVLIARMLWTFSAAYRMTGRPEYLHAAGKLRKFLALWLIDPVHGGVYWEIAPDGSPVCGKKQSYAIGFAVYGLSEYVRATGDPEALDEAAALFGSLEEHVWDAMQGGYVEALTRNWKPLEDMRLSEKDANTYFSMNTHLHLLEPYANLLRVWREDRVATAVRKLIHIHTDRLFDPQTGHLNLFFDARWQPQGRKVSYGHDIEASWLIDEAALVLGEPQVTTDVGPVVEALAAAAVEGLRPDGSLIYEYDPQTERIDADRHWWVQAEAVVGFFNMYERTGDEAFLRRSHDAWQYIRTHLLDGGNGEWFWSVRADGSVNRDDDKAGFWKCPYHNSRMCMELIRRIERLLTKN